MKAQGLPLNTIVLGALAVLVLVILAAAFVPSIRNVFLSILGLTPAGDPYTQCDMDCSALSGRYTTSTAGSAICSSAYCANRDLDGDGTAATDEYCPGFKASCIVSTIDGKTVTVTPDAADNTCDYTIESGALTSC